MDPLSFPFDDLFGALGFLPQKTFREGPRVYIIGGVYKARRAVFKALFPSEEKKDIPYYHSPLKHLLREALFLENVPPYLSPFVPKILRSGWEGKRFWYLTEWIRPGVKQSGGGDFLVREEFFSQKGLRWLLDLSFSLGKFSSELPPKLSQALSQTTYDLSAYRGMLESQGKGFFGEKAFSYIADFLDKAEPIYNQANQTILAHHEIKGSEILSWDKSFKLIDWETVGWGNLSRDFMTLYLRAFEYPDWRKEYLGEHRARFPDQKVYDVLFGVEFILQSFGNLSYLSSSQNPLEQEKKEKYLAFVERSLKEILV